MEGGSYLRRQDREALRERWLLRAGQAFERMFAAANQEQLVTFTEREDMACLLGKELAAFLLEEHAADGQVRHVAQPTPDWQARLNDRTADVANVTGLRDG